MRRTKKKPDKWANAASWIQNRRVSVQKAVAKATDVPKVQTRLAARLWSQKHEKEKQFNLGKERVRRTLSTKIKHVSLFAIQNYIIFFQ